MSKVTSIMKREKFWNELEFKPIRKPLGHLISRRRPAAQPNGKRGEKKNARTQRGQQRISSDLNFINKNVRHVGGLPQQKSLQPMVTVINRYLVTQHYV